MRTLVANDAVDESPGTGALEPRQIPVHRQAHWFAGHLPRLRDDILGFFAECEREYGAIVRLRLYAEPFYLVSAPELIQDVLVNQHRNFEKPTGLKAVKPMFGEGLLTSEGEHWQAQRKLIQRSFMRECLDRYATTAVACTSSMLGAWSDGETKEIYSTLNELTLEIVARSLFGTDVRAGREVITAGTEGIQDYFSSWRQHYLPLPLWLPLRSTSKLRRSVRALDAMVHRLIENRQASDGAADDLLTQLVNARYSDGTRMSRRLVRDELVTLFLAGHETSAVALVWAFVLLSKHPAVRTKLQLELDTVLAGRTPSVEDLPQLPYLDWVFKEVLRLYPSAYNIGRVSKAACHIGGYPIGRGRNVIMCQWAVHRSQRYYEQPAQFIPERWQPAQASQRPKFAYFPFGAGPRNCIGAQFATLEAKLILAVVWQRFTLELSPDAQVGVDAALTLRPTHRLPMRLRRRPVNGRMA